MDWLTGFLSQVTGWHWLGLGIFMLVLEIGHERQHFEATFPTLDVVWRPTSAGDDQGLRLAL
jgi:hypothetical protein